MSREIDINEIRAKHEAHGRKVLTRVKNQLSSLYEQYGDNVFPDEESPSQQLVEKQPSRTSQKMPKVVKPTFVITGPWVTTIVENHFKLTHEQGSVFDYRFRHKVVADVACAILNETNKVDDRRLVRLLNLCEREKELLRLMKPLKESKDPKYQQYKNELDQVRGLLGVKPK